jgi:hypothetical protein
MKVNSIKRFADADFTSASTHKTHIVAQKQNFMPVESPESQGYSLNLIPWLKIYASALLCVI